MTLFHVKCVGVFDHDGPVLRERTMRKVPESDSVDPMVIDDIKIIPFTGVVAEPDIGHNNILYPAVLDEGTERKFGGKGSQYFQPRDVGREFLIAIGEFDSVEFIKSAQLPGRG